MKLQPSKNENYCATVVELSQFKELAGCDNLKAAIIFGNQVIVGKEEEAGSLGLFFPIETQLSHDFLAANNLYRKPEYGNKDPEAKTGFFDQNGRVRAMKLRGHRSEGFYIPLSSLHYINMEDPGELFPGVSFDVFEGNEICRKYVPKHNPAPTSVRGARVSLLDQLVPNQFRFHSDTPQLKRHIDRLRLEDQIVITDTWHGTSCILANLLVKRKLNFIERFLDKIGIKIQKQEYAGIWASRRIIKGIDASAGGLNEYHRQVHFYDEDVWGNTYYEYRNKIPKGYTVYGEIVGYTKSGAEIQRGYTYGCALYTSRFVVYRVTFTNPDGLVEELNWPRLKTFCSENGFEYVFEHYYGSASGIFCTRIEVLESFYASGQCNWNGGKVPKEGCVIRIERVNGYENYKLKNFAFLERETKQLDAGEIDLESAQDVLQ